MDPAAQNLHDSPLKDKEIFIIEDDPFIGQLLSQKISAYSMHTTIFESGEDALKAIETKTPDIILLDILLPGMDGFQVLESLKNNEKTKNIPVLIASNTNQVGNQERAKNLGVNFLMKALVTPDAIISEMEHLVQESKK